MNELRKLAEAAAQQTTSRTTYRQRIEAFRNAVTPTRFLGILDERDALRQIVTDLAAKFPGDGLGWCRNCGHPVGWDVVLRRWTRDVDPHDESCVWRRAVEATKATMEEGT